MEKVVITGANRGIGLELTKLFLRADKHVVATCRNPKGSIELQELADAGRLSVFQLEVTDSDSVTNFCDSLSGQTIDVLINNAGIMGGERQSIDDMVYDAWLQAFSVNTLAPFQLATRLIDNLKQAQRPRIVSLSSQMASLNSKSVGSYAYRSSKVALNKVMQVLATELEADGIIVCPVHPGWVQTNMGGSTADITVQESASGLFQLISSLTMEQSGRFWTWQGNEQPW